MAKKFPGMSPKREIMDFLKVMPHWEMAFLDEVSFWMVMVIILKSHISGDYLRMVILLCVHGFI